MGVKGLWDLLAPAGRRVAAGNLKGKIVAVDAAIWLVQFLHAMKLPDGSPMPAAHLVGFFNRLCRLLFFEIRPIIVFDGPPPFLKRQTLLARKRQRQQQEKNLRSVVARLLLNRLKEKRRQEQEGAATTQDTASQAPGPHDIVSIPDTPTPSSASLVPSKSPTPPPAASPRDDPSHLSVPAAASSSALARRGDVDGTEGGPSSRLFSSGEESEAEGGRARRPDPESGEKKGGICTRSRRRSFAASDSSEEPLDVEDTSDEDVSVEAETRSRSLAPPVPEELRGFLSSRRQLGDLPMPSVLSMPASAASTKAFENLGLPSLIKRGQDGESRKIVRRAEDFKAYRLEDDSFVQLPLDAEIDQEVFDLLPPKVQFQILTQLRDAWLHDSRVKALQAKNNIFVFSNIQLESYIRSVQANQQLTTVKMRLAAAQHQEGESSRLDAAESRHPSSSSSSVPSFSEPGIRLPLPALPSVVGRGGKVDIKGECLSPDTSPASSRPRPAVSSVRARPLHLFSGGREVEAVGRGGQALAAEWTSLSGALSGAATKPAARGTAVSASEDRAFALDGGLKLPKQKGFVNDLTRLARPLDAPREAAVLTPSELLASATKAARQVGAGRAGSPAQRGDGRDLWTKLKEEEEGRRQRIREKRRTGRCLREDEREEDDDVIVTGSGEKQHIALLDDREIFGDAFFDSSFESSPSGGAPGDGRKATPGTEPLRRPAADPVCLLEADEHERQPRRGRRAPAAVTGEAQEAVAVAEETHETARVPRGPHGEVVTVEDESDEFDDCIVDTSDEISRAPQTPSSPCLAAASSASTSLPAATPVSPTGRSGSSAASVPSTLPRPGDAAGPASGSDLLSHDTQAAERGEGRTREEERREQEGVARNPGPEAQAAAQTQDPPVRRPRWVRRRGFGRTPISRAPPSSSPAPSGQVPEDADSSAESKMCSVSSSSAGYSSVSPSPVSSPSAGSCASSSCSSRPSAPAALGMVPAGDAVRSPGNPGRRSEDDRLSQGRETRRRSFEGNRRERQNRAPCCASPEKETVGRRSRTQDSSGLGHTAAACADPPSLGETSVGHRRSGTLLKSSPGQCTPRPRRADANTRRSSGGVAQSEKGDTASSSPPLVVERESAAAAGSAGKETDRQTKDEKKEVGADTAEDLVDKLLAELGTVSFPQEAGHRAFGGAEGRWSRARDGGDTEKDDREGRKRRQEEEGEFMQLWLAVFPQLKEHLPEDQRKGHDSKKPEQSGKLGSLSDDSADEIGAELKDDGAAAIEERERDTDGLRVWDGLFFDTEAGVSPGRAARERHETEELPSSVEREQRAKSVEAEMRTHAGRAQGHPKQTEGEPKGEPKRGGAAGASQGLQPRLPSSPVFPTGPEMIDELSTPPPASRSSQSALMTMGGSSADEQLREKLEEEKLLLLQQAGMLQQQTGNVTERMKDQVVALLRAFGVPFVTAPGEAEATAAYFTAQNLADAVISDDSDALVFGAREIYRNFFENKKSVEMYEASFIAHKLGLDQQQLILLAMLLGCDYTLGVKGIGIVNAVEVLRAYPSLDALRAFRAWAEAPWTLGIEAADSAEVRKYKEAHKNYRLQWLFPHDFPSPEVFDAFESPLVDRSREPFSWAVPDVEAIVSIMTHAGGLRRSEVLDCLLPAVKRYTAAHAFQRQTRITAFLPFVERNNKAASSAGANQEGRTGENLAYATLAKAAEAAEAAESKRKTGKRRNGDTKSGRGDEAPLDDTQVRQGDGEEERETQLESVAVWQEREERRMRHDQAFTECSAEAQRQDDEDAVGIIRSERMLRAVSVLGQRRMKGQQTTAASGLTEEEAKGKEKTVSGEDGRINGAGREKDRKSGDTQMAESVRDTASVDSDHEKIEGNDKKRMRHGSPCGVGMSDLREEDAALLATMLQELDADAHLETVAAAAEAELENSL
ncbi:putative RAD2 endonuclease [Neospora caninum Liverpool]|uniref:Putative RAD2 endonuclease n=1 Tax=Neospora caninum (strain Liverpool) TaxID=572307 RepID=F0VJT6_NEOCL|nr:putative RAD2 endonuclease [Neospora caninum Liverpool]CBZ53997.1 putative RAD2 endonuclease [Neospora caninum Liverpool]|eukprot:XP_003884029.1 putative RAD2 endonuclease [Neospora caninum Liverpool]